MSVHAVDASANSLSFGGAWNYVAQGLDPTVAVNADGNEIEVHGTYVNSTWWLTTSYIGQTQVNYTPGFFPTIAADHNSYNMVEMHNGNLNTIPIWYSIGDSYAYPTPSWSVYTSFTTGYLPSVTAFSAPWQSGFPANAVVMDVHNGGTYDANLWLDVGTPSNPGGAWGGITWHGASRYNWGFPAAISMVFSSQQATGNGTYAYKYAFVEVHGGAASNGGDTGLLWSDTGILTVNYPSMTWSIQWVNTSQYTPGHNPSIAICDNYDSATHTYTAVEAHEGGDGTLWAFYGRFNPSNGTLTWENGYEYASVGYQPHVSCAGTYGTEVHLGAYPYDSNKLWTSTFTAN